ncbi:MAG TPA: tetraacyldisaccharide 4'-kinase [Terriglobia bacterium]|nr:tetraacyldisaccharide 4'-kinase [Terriglobia bacterium]
MSELVLRWLARLYGTGARVHGAAYERGWLRRRRLPRPVISIGNLTAGGTGKTPLVRWTAEHLAQHGFRPAILTRGYRRDRGPDAIVIPPKDGRLPETREVGDEAAWLARTLPQVPIGVSADRFRTGELIAENYPVDVFVLDDGFQHRQIERDLDVVALDAMRGISDNEILPAGLQREPTSALGRAGVVVITRAELVDGRRLETFRSLVRGIHPRVTLVEARTRLECLRDLAGGAESPAEPLLGPPVHGFCGIGNPDAFFKNLRLWGFDVVRESVFPDHHVYRDLDFARDGGVAAFLTTEKDAMNLAGVSLSAASAPVLACVTRLEIEDDALLDEKFNLLLGRPPGMET